MKKVFIVLSIVSLFVVVKKATSYARNEAKNYAYIEKMDPIVIKKVSITTNIQKIVGESTSADYNIIGDAPTNAYVEVLARPNNNKKMSSDDIQKILNEKYVLDIQIVGNELKLIAKRKSGFGWSNNDNINLVFNVHAPAKVSTKISTTSGDVILKGLNGDQYFTATSGDISMEGIKGIVHLNTTSGDASLADLSGSQLSFESTSGDISFLKGLFDNITIKTTSGDVNISGTSGNVKASSSSGDLRILLTQGSVEAGSSSGDQHLEVSNPKNYIRTSAGSGDVRIKVPSRIGADINLRGSSVSLSDKSKFVGEFSKEKSAVGKWNGGGIPIEAKTGSGDIDLDFN